MIWVTVIDKPFHIFRLESAVTPGSQAIGMKHPCICPLSHCVGMDMKEVSTLPGGQHRGILCVHLHIPLLYLSLYNLLYATVSSILCLSPKSPMPGALVVISLAKSPAKRGL